MRRFLCVLFAACFLLAMTGCDFDSDDYTVSYDLAADPINLDPQTAADQASLTVIHNIFEGLYTMNALGEPEAALAESYQRSPDGLQYTFTLRRDAKWVGTDEDGTESVRPVTARDFVFAFQRLLRPDTKSPASSQFTCIANAAEVAAGVLPEAQLGVRAVSDYTLEFTLVTPNENFLHLLASTYALPCNEAFFLQTRGKYGLEPSSIMANGAFDLRSWTHGRQVRLIRNDHYYAREETLPAGVNLWINSSGQSEETRLLEGVVDAAFVRGEKVDSLSGAEFNTEPIENSVWGLYINQESPSLANVNIRRAIASAFDRSTYQPGLPAYLTVANGMIPHGVTVYGQNFRRYAGDIPIRQLDAVEAYDYYKAGLEELGVKSVGGIKLLVNGDSSGEVMGFFQSASQILQKELSLFLTIDMVSEGDYHARLRSGSFDIALYEMEAADNSPWAILTPFQSGDSRNYISYENGELDSILARAVQQGTREEMLLAGKEAERLILQDAAFIPMCYSTDYFVTRQKITGIAYNPQTGLVSFRSAAQA